MYEILDPYMTKCAIEHLEIRAGNYTRDLQKTDPTQTRWLSVQAWVQFSSPKPKGIPTRDLNLEINSLYIATYTP